MRVASCRTFQIPIAQALAQVPAGTQYDDFTLEMSPFEEGRRLNCPIRPGCFCVLPLTLSNRSVFCDRAIDVAFSPDGRAIYVGSTDGTVRTYGLINEIF